MAATATKPFSALPHSNKKNKLPAKLRLFMAAEKQYTQKKRIVTFLIYFLLSSSKLSNFAHKQKVFFN